MARPSGPKVRCGDRWTEARFRNFIFSTLRGATRRWAPISDVLKSARVRRGFYLCNGCKQEVPSTIKSENGRRIKNAVVDHVHPIVDPAKGFTTFDEYIERMFCEADNLQVLCHECHQEKTNKETAIASERRKNDKDKSV